MLADQLLRVCQSSQHELWLVAPFIKLHTLQRLLEGVSSTVVIRCVTRWRPEEIAIGVSDIDVWLLLNERGNSHLWIRNDLHAKYYRADETCLIGSANLTATALGWSFNPNLELLLDVPIHHPALASFESELLAKAISVDDALYEQTKDLVMQLKPEIKSVSHPEQSLEAISPVLVNYETWLPTWRNPEKLYWAYRGEKDKFSSSIYDLAVVDLQVLGIPLGLSQSGFESYVGYVLLHMPIVRKVDLFVSQPRRFGEVSAYLKTLPCAKLPEFDSKFAWQTLMRWLSYFLPARYNQWVDNYTEMISSSSSN